MSEEGVINCEACGKRLIRRMKDGTFHFAFGKNEENGPPVDLLISGCIKIKCIRRGCGHWNILGGFER